MEKTATKKLFTNEELQSLRESLPGKYYPEFQKLWKKTFKGEEPPIRQVVYSVLSGLSENDKALSVLIAMVEERNKLKAHMNNVVNGVQYQASSAN
jgi:hypothetical protein